MKIEMVLPSLEVGGMEAVTAELGRQLSARGHDVGFTCTQEIGPIGEALSTEGFRVERVPAPGLLTNVLPLRLTRWLRELAPDVTHVHSGVLLKAATAARRAGRSAVVFTVHGLHPGEPRHVRLINRRAAALADQIVAVSEPIAEYLRLVLRARAPVSIVHNGVDTTRFAPGPRSHVLRRRLGIADDDVLIGNIARFDPRKNQEALLQAFDRAFSNEPKIHLALVGWGPEKAKLELLWSALASRSRIHISEPHLDAPALFRDLDFFVLPSHTEGTSMSLLEAMASGTPIVATAVGATPWVLQNGKVGALLEGTDVPSVARGLAHAIAHRAQARSMADAARARVQAHFSAAAVAERYERIYDAARVAPLSTVTGA